MQTLEKQWQPRKIEQESTDQPESRFAIAGTRAVKELGALGRSQAWFDEAMPVTDNPDSPNISGMDALLHIESHPIGLGLSRQTARYGTLHQRLPVAPLRGSAAEAYRQDAIDYFSGDEVLSQDLHPLLHMGRVAHEYHNLLAYLHYEGLLRKEDAYPIRVAEHSLSIHDIGESEHPLFQEIVGDVVGDVTADTPKTSAQRKTERLIFTNATYLMLGRFYTHRFIDDATNFVSHTVSHLSEGYQRQHGLGAVAHGINSLVTGRRFGELTNDDSASIGLRYQMSILAESTIPNVKHEFHTAIQQSPFSPEEKDALIEYTVLPLREAGQTAGALHENHEYMSWRLSYETLRKYGPPAPEVDYGAIDWKT